MKFQVPTVGGIRKVIRPEDTAAALTTISAVLQQLIDAVASLQTPVNTGGGNIGTGNEASISVSPGLSGGGDLVGVVNIGLTQPPALIAEDGIDGDPGIQGVPGPQGKQGIPGAYWFGEDGADGDPGLPGTQGIQGIQGAAGAAGTPSLNPLFQDDIVDNDAGAFGIATPAPIRAPANINPPGYALIPDDISVEEFTPFPLTDYIGNLNVMGLFNVNAPGAPGVLQVRANGTVFLNPPAGAAAMQANGVDNKYAGVFIGSTTTGQSLGFIVQAGTNGSDFSFVCQNAAAANLFTMNGAGNAIIATPSSGGTTLQVGAAATGNISIQAFGKVFGSILIATAATPPAAAGQTAIGTTTTSTVITTAGGIALPALASTFWVANVNGVAYGIPCFAL